MIRWKWMTALAAATLFVTACAGSDPKPQVSPENSIQSRSAP